jgi:hypothetical protein
MRAGAHGAQDRRMQKRLISSAVAAIAVISWTGLALAADEPTDSIDVAKLQLDTESHAYTMEYLSRDSDGDGWTDWYERLDGTDPHDPTSHPGGVRVDLIETTVFVQSLAFPDRFVAIDGLELPTTQDAFGELTDLVGSITGSTTLGKFRDELAKEVSTIAGNLVDDMLSDANKLHELALETGVSEFGRRTNGQNASLLSWEVSGAAGSNGASVSVSTEHGSSSVQIDGNGVTVVNSSDNIVGGNGIEITTVSVNGELVLTVKTEYVNGVVVGKYPSDGSGNPLPPLINPLSTATTVPVAKPVETTATTVVVETTTPATTVAPTEVTTPPSTEAPYTNPDADPIPAPTAQEVEERVAFLSGVRTQYLPTLDLPTELDKDKPGVADPAEPECRQDGCVAFTVIMHPDLDKADGACPRTYCNSGPPNGGRP